MNDSQKKSEVFYTPKATPKDIQRLIRDDYSNRPIQELLAELILNTENQNSKCRYKRFNIVINAILGPSIIIEKKRGTDDEESLHRAFYLISNKSMSAWAACEEVAYSLHVKGFIIGKSSEKPDLSNSTHQRVQSTTRRLHNKIQNENITPKKFHGFQMVQALEDESRMNQAHKAKSMMRHWLKRYH